MVGACRGFGLVLLGLVVSPPQLLVDVDPVQEDDGEVVLAGFVVEGDDLDGLSA